MPINGPSEFTMYSLNGIPLFTYGMIGITTIVLAYVTFMDDSEGNSFVDVNGASKEEPKEEVKEEIKEEPKEEIKEEPKEEVNEEPKEEPILTGGKKSKKNKTKRKSSRRRL